MKKRLLFVSLFLISILFISSCVPQESMPRYSGIADQCEWVFQGGSTFPNEDPLEVIFTVGAQCPDSEDIILTGSCSIGEGPNGEVIWSGMRSNGMFWDCRFTDVNNHESAYSSALCCSPVHAGASGNGYVR
tara:strand:+ start:1730 stop:2125 length:396 start_codon:yes stop_codon:yes gene_type:complete